MKEWKIVVMLALAGVFSGCVEPVPNDDPLPPELLSKSLFEESSEWWMSRTVIDVPYTAAFTYVGDGDYPDRIRWRIEEDYLIGYRSKPQYLGVDEDVAGGNDYQAPAAMYPIRRHLDVFEGQLLDAPKRPWYEREYIEVDWGSEASGSHRFQLSRVEEIPRSGPSYWISDPADENHPIFSADYIDFTTHITIAPTELDQIPTGQKICDIRVAAFAVDLVDCSPANVAYRTSFRRIPADYQYEMATVPTSDNNTLAGLWANRLWNMGRAIIDDQLGPRDDNFFLLRSRFNLWRRSFDDEGEPLPLHERELKPLVFHVGQSYPLELVPELEAAAATWDVVFQSALTRARVFSCIDAGGSAGECSDQFSEIGSVLRICPHSPVQAEDPPECGGEGTVARLGDTRYNLVHWETAPDSLWGLGLGWWTPDPSTGESTSSWMSINPSGIDRNAATYRDLILVAQGRLDPEEYVLGLTNSQWLQDIENYSLNPFASLVNLPVSSEGPIQPPLPVIRPPAESLRPINFGGDSTLTYENAMRPFVGTQVESMVMDAESLLVAGINPEEPQMPSDVFERASPLRTPFHARARPARDLARERLKQIGADVEMPVDLDLFPLIEQMRDSSPDEIYETIRRRYLLWVLTHEFGHIFGLRHNFAGSFDALNYEPGYWDLRGVDPTNGPRYLDPPTTEERDGLIQQYAYSSVMDYMSTPNLSPTELGYYDEAAIHYLYGGLVQVFANPQDQAGEDYLEAEHLRNSILGHALYRDDNADPINRVFRGLHYSKIPTVVSNLGDRDYVPEDRLSDPFGWGRGSVDDQGRIVVPFVFCGDEILEFRTWCNRYDKGADVYEIVQHHINWYRSNYGLNSWRRGRPEFSTTSYVEHIWPSVFEPMRNILGHYVHYREEFTEAEFLDPDTLGPDEEGIREMFRFLTGLLVLPEAGDYYLVENVGPEGDVLLSTQNLIGEVSPYHTTTHTVSVEPPPGDPVATVQLGQGRYYRSAVFFAGQTLSVLNAGSAVDKELALEALLSPEFWWFPGRDSWPDARIWSVNYSRVFEEELLDVLGSLIAGDMTRFAPRLDGNVVRSRDFLNQDEVLPGQLMDPAFGFNLRMRTLVFGLALHFSHNPDRSFFDFSRVVIDGSSEDYLSPRAPVLFVNPESLETYKAYRYDESGRELGIGARLLDRAIALDSAAQGLGGETPEQQEEAARMLLDQLDVIDAIRAVVATYYENAFDPGTITEQGRPDDWP